MANVRKNSMGDGGGGALSEQDRDMLKTPLNKWAPETIKKTQEDMFDLIELETREQDKMKKKLIGIKMVCGYKGCKEETYALITKANRQQDGSVPKVAHWAICKACHFKKDITHKK